MSLSFHRELAILLAAAGLVAGCDDEPGVSLQLAAISHPPVVDFGRVPVGIGRTLRFDVENVGRTTARILDVVPETSGSAQVEVDPKRMALAPGEARPLTVRFFPSSVRERIEVGVEIRTDVPGQERRMVQVVGQGVRQGLLASPERLRFGPVVRGRTATQAFTLRSLLPDPIEPEIEVESTAGAGRFAIESGPERMEPGEEASVRVRYIPAPTGDPETDRATAVVQFCPRSACAFPVAMDGQAVLTPLVCAPDAIEFGYVRPDRRRVGFTECVNTGQRPIVVSGARASSDTAEELVVPELPRTRLSPGEALNVEVRLDLPVDAELGPRAGTLVVEAEDAEDAEPLAPVEVPLSVQVGGGVLTARPGAVDFGLVAVGMVGNAQILLRNDGDRLVDLVRLDTEAPFSVEQPRTRQLIPGEEVAVDVRFSPGEEGPFEGRLRILSDAAEGAELSIPLGGTALLLEPCSARWEPSPLDLGEALLFRTTARAAQLRNVGDTTCLVREGRLGPSSDSALSLVEGGGQSVLLMPGEALPFVVSFRPVRGGTARGILVASTSSPGQSDVALPVQGFGSTQGLILSPDELDFGELALGCRTDETVRLFNPTGATHRLTAARLVVESPGPTPFDLQLPTELAEGRELALEPGGSTQFVVGFTPDGSGARALARLEVDVAGRASPISAGILGGDTLDPFIEERWVQSGSGSVDILLVIDNSSSMGAEQQRLQMSFPRFMRYAADRGLDYRVSVITTDTAGGGACLDAGADRPPGAPRGACGYFSDGTGSQTDPDWRVIQPHEQPSPETAFARTSAVGLDGSAVEAGLLAATMALDPVRLTGWNQGFLGRPGAFLGVVFLSDEDDRSPGDAALYEAAIAATKGARFSREYAISGIVIDPGGCGNGQGEGAARYVGAIRRSGGTLGSICATDYDDVIDRMARAAAGERERFVLRRPAFSPSVEVSVDRVPLAAVSNGKRRWSFDRGAGAVVFEPASVPRAGAEVVIRYRPLCRPVP